MPPKPSEKPLTPEEKKALEALKTRWDYKPLDAVSSAFTAGCSLSLPAAPFEAAHYAQADVSLNKALWDMWPTDPEGLDSYINTHQDRADRLFKPLSTYWPEEEPAYNLEQLREALPAAERARIGANLRLLNELHVRLHRTGLLPFNTLSEGLSPLTLLGSRKKMFDVPPLEQAVKAGKRLKAEADATFNAVPTREHGEETPAQAEARHTGAIEALGSYCSALLGLWPWTASGLIMSPETAFESGIAQLEAQLWTDIATATVTLTGYKGSRGSSDQRTAEGMYFSVLARLCNLVPLLTRFVPLDKYWSSHSSMMLYAMVLPDLGFGYELAAGMEGTVLSALYGGDDGWAHAQCDERHSTCTLGGVDRSRMKLRSPPSPPKKAGEAEIEPISDSDSAPGESGPSSGSASKRKEDEGWEEDGEEIKYYDRRGRVVGQGPRVPVRFTGHIMPAHQTSKPSTAYPCD